MNFFRSYPLVIRLVYNLNEGDALIVAIAKQDSALAYQWFKDEFELEGETDTILVIDQVTAEDAGIYTCKTYGTALLSPPMVWESISEFVSEPFVVSVIPADELRGHKNIESGIDIFPNPADEMIYLNFLGISP